MTGTISVFLEVNGIGIKLDFPEKIITCVLPENPLEEIREQEIEHFKHHLEALLSQLFQFLAYSQAIATLAPGFNCSNVHMLYHLLEHVSSQTRIFGEGLRGKQERVFWKDKRDFLASLPEETQREIARLIELLPDGPTA